MKPKNIIYMLLVLILFNIQCQQEEEECGEIHITGYVKDGINQKPLDSVDVSLWYGTSMDLGMRHTVSYTMTDSTGYFEIRYTPKEKHLFEFSIDPDSYVYIVDEIYNYSYEFQKYSSYQKEISCSYIAKLNDIYLSPYCFLKLILYDPIPLNKGDSLILFHPKKDMDITYSYNYTNPPPDYKVFKQINAGQNQQIKWKIKRGNKDWETNTIDIYCEPFVVNVDTLRY